MDPGSSAPGRPHPRSPATGPHAHTPSADGHSLGPRPAQPDPAGCSGGARHSQALHQTRAAGAGSGGSVPAAQPALLRELSALLGTEQRCGRCPWGWAFTAAPPALPVAQRPGHICWGSPWALSLPSLEGLSALSLPSALWHRSELRASITQPCLPHRGSVSCACPQLLTWLQLGTPGRG